MLLALHRSAVRSALTRSRHGCSVRITRLRSGSSAALSRDGRRVLVAAAAAGAAAAYLQQQSVRCDASSSSRGELITRLTNELPESMRVAFLTPKQIEQTVCLINAILDLGNFSDAEEDVIFRHAVCAVLAEVERKMPRPFMKLLHHANPEEGLGTEQAHQLSERLSKLVGDAVSLPYLSTRHEAQVVACVVELVVGGMGRGRCFDDMLAIEHAGPVVMKIFVKGNAGAFFSEREAIAAGLAEDMDVPFVPPSWKLKACRYAVGVIGELLEKAHRLPPCPPAPSPAVRHPLPASYHHTQGDPLGL